MTKQKKRILWIGIPVGCVLLAAACLLFVWRNGQVQKTRYGADYTAAGYEAARGAGRYTPVSLRQAVGDTELTIEEIYADRKQVCIRYTVSDGAAPLSGDPSSYLLAGRCRIEIDGVPYEKVQDTRTGAAVENGRYEASLLLDAADYPADFSFSETPRLVLTVTDYPGLQGETALEASFRVFDAETESIDAAQTVDGELLRLQTLEKGAAAMTLHFSEVKDEALEQVELSCGDTRYPPLQIDYRNREVRFPALEDGVAYTVLVNGRPLFESVY